MDDLTEAEAEQIAREYCRLMSVDPDERLHCSHPKGYAVMWTRPRWQIVMDEVYHVEYMNRAFSKVRNCV